jgi:large repetitive protein
MNRFSVRSTAFLAVFFALFLAPALHAALTVQPITWNVIGLDSNAPLTGPKYFPVGARVCSNVATTNVSVSFVWDSANALVALRSGSLSTINFPSIGAGTCADAYFEVEVTQVPAAFDTTRRYHITATDVSGTASSPTPREVYVEHLISQNRNSISDVKFGTSVPSLLSVPAGGGMSMVVGNTYVVQLIGGTATQGYNQFEEFINFSNTVFQILSVQTTYSANNSPYVTGPFPAVADKLYADACLWDNDPNSPTYRECAGGDFKSGGTNVVTTYTIRVVGGGGTSEALNALLYDFSGSSYHYNADWSSSARIANIIDPTTSTISKSFIPNPAPLNGVSALTFMLTNPNPGTLTGYNFVDTLPANLVVATPPATTTTGCGTPTLTAVAGSGSISFSNGTLAANSTCVVKVNVTPTATGTLNNTTGNLFIGAIDTGDNASASLTVNTAPPPGTGLCNLVLARWNFPTGMSTTAPVATVANVTATASAGAGLAPAFSATDNTIAPAGTGSWRSNGSTAVGTPLSTANDDYFEFAINTTGQTSVTLAFDAFRTNNGARGIAVYWGTSATPPGAQAFATDLALPAATTWAPFTHTFNTGLNPSGTTYFRIYVYNSSNVNPGADVNLDNVVFTACGPATPPSIAKSFAPDPIAVNGVSTLTFTLTNPNTTALTGGAFSDTLPSGVQVAATPAAATTCAGATWAPVAGSSTLTFSGATLPASGSCTVSVNVTATTAGAHANVSGFLSTVESGTSITTVATDTLTAVLPPPIAKQFDPNPIVDGQFTTLTFTITNPNQDNALSGVAFGDTFPATPGVMIVAAVPNASTSGCGAPAFSPVAGAGSISFSGATIAGGGTCIVSVDVTVSEPGSYMNTTGPVSHVINAQTINGNTASATLDVAEPAPGLSFLKQIGPSASGPWSSYFASTGPAYYRFTIENTGDVPLTNLTVTDDNVGPGTCAAFFAGIASLPVADANDDDHIVTCVIGSFALAGPTVTNIASAHAEYNGEPVDSNQSSAEYAVPALTLDKTAAQSTFTTAGETLNYSYLVTNSGAAILDGPITVADDKATVTCPALSTIGDLDNFFDPGEAITCTASYLTTGGDVSNAFVTNTATATADGVNSNADSVTVPLSTSADVSIVKTLITAGPFTAGQSIQYTLLVANAGPSTATAVQVTDTPANLTITNVSGGGCVALPCTIPLLAPGADATITVTATITAAGAFDNAATVDANEPDPDPTDNTDNTGNGGTAAASADVSIVKTLITAGPFTGGQSIQYTLFVANAGPSAATSIQVTDTPSNLSITNVSGGGCVALPCTIASLASGANTTITVTATITAAGAFDNTATANGAETDPNPTNNTDNTGNNGTAAASADVSIVKSLITAGPFTIGQTIQYTLFVANAGPSTATSVQVTDTPSNLSITNVSGGGCVALPCTIASLASGANTPITVTATITAAGAFDNTAAANGVESDPNTANNTDSTGNGGTAAASADVSIVKTLLTAGPFNVGQSIQYTLFVANAGPSTATSIQVTDTPANLTITNVSGGGCVALPCTIASLASGANTTITVTATIDATGAFDNTATANGAEPDPNTANNTDSTGNNGSTASADVGVVKTLITAGPFTVGDSIQYTLFVTNAGPSTATSIQVTDTPTNLTITNVSGGGCAALPCSIASLASGANTTITVTATINVAGTFDNAAAVDAVETDTNPSNDTDTSGNNGTAAASADVSIVKTLITAGPFTIGQSIQYTLFVANAGPSTATSVQVTDTPSNLTITNVSGGACAALPCTIASLASGANTTITVTATIDAAGAFDNAASANGAEPDPDPSDNTDDKGNNGTAAPSADVSIVKTLNPTGPYSAGQAITYTLFVANAGPSTATSIQVTDTPSNLTITNVSGGGCAALPCTIASLASGANVVITVTATINASGAFDNTATAVGVEADPNLANNTDNTGNAGVTGVSADLSIVKTLTTAGPFTIGQPVTYTLLVANAGPSTATSIQVTDTPANLTITNVSGAGCAALPCTIPSLASGANVVITVTATITAAGAFDNVATANAVETDPDPSNNTDSTGNNGTALASADVSIVKTLLTAGPFTAGQSIQYSLVVANAGPSTATSIQVTDTPTNLTITSVTGACVALPCTIPSLASGANTLINVTATINTAGAFNNVATANAVEPDPNTANNTDSVGNGGTTGAASADLMIVKTASAPLVQIGDSLTYTLVLTNNGPSTATNVVVSDPLPSNFALTSATPTQGTCSGTTTVNCTLGTVLNGGSVTIAIQGTVTGTGSLENTATVTASETDPVPNNNTSTAAPALGGNIPTASEYGLMLLALMLGIAGMLVVRR